MCCRHREVGSVGSQLELALVPLLKVAAVGVVGLLTRHALRSDLHVSMGLVRTSGVISWLFVFSLFSACSFESWTVVGEALGNF